MMLKYYTSRKRYFTTTDLNKFTSETLDAKIKQKQLVNKFDFSCLAKNYDLNTTITKLATKTDLKSEKHNIMEMQTHDLSFFSW